MIRPAYLQPGDKIALIAPAGTVSAPDIEQVSRLLADWQLVPYPAPHLLAEKQGPYTRAASGGPLVQHSLPLMLQLMEQGEITLTQIVDHMCHAPADIFRVERRGYLRPGYQADITIIERNPWTITRDNIRYRCGWSPLEGTTLDYRVHATLVNGNIVYRDGQLDETTRGQLLTFQA